MTDRPILFSAPMVRALLAGTKTQTRRVVKHDPQLRPIDIDVFAFDPERGEWEMGESHMGNVAHVGWVRCPYGAPGDRLWCREAWAVDYIHDGAAPSLVTPTVAVTYRASEDALGVALNGRRGQWRPSIHMPRWASRLTLEVVAVRVERLQDISEADAIAEGIVEQSGSAIGVPVPGYGLAGCSGKDLMNFAVDAYRSLWESINGEGSWEKNPWCWVVEFRRLP